MPKRKQKPRASKVTYGYRRIHRSTTGQQLGKGKRSIFRTHDGDRIIEAERSLESLWMERTPEGWNFLDWFRAWNEGYPDEMAIDIYNNLWPDDPDRHIALEGDEDDA